MTAPAGAIRVRQNTEPFQRLFRAFTFHYRRASRWRSLRTFGTVGLALAAPVVTILAPGSSAILGALAGGWVLVARTFLARREGDERRRAAVIQEQFDVELFGLPWNEGVTGKQVAPDDVADAARRVDAAGLDWYPDADRLPWPVDVVLCQRGSAVWGRRTHAAYATVLAVAAASWFAAGVTLAAIRAMSLSAYLVGLFLPSQPAFLDAADLWQSHRRRAAAKLAIEACADELVDKHAAGAVVTVDDCRALQDKTFLLRAEGPPVPGWFYRLRRGRDQHAMDAGVDAITQRIGP